MLLRSALGYCELGFQPETRQIFIGQQYNKKEKEKTVQMEVVPFFYIEEKSLDNFYKIKPIKKTLSMKKMNFYSSMIVLALSGCMMSSCNNDEDDLQTDVTAQKHTFELSGYYNANDTNATRLTYDKTSRNFLWDAGDVITIYNADGTQSVTAAVDNGTGTNLGHFTATASFEPAYVTFGVMEFTPTRYNWGSTTDLFTTYDKISSSEGNVMAASPVAKVSDGVYNFRLQHKLAYMTATFTKTMYPGEKRGLTVKSTNGISGTVKMNYKGETTVTLNDFSDGSFYSLFFDLDIPMDGSRYSVLLPGGTITSIISPMLFLQQLLQSPLNIEAGKVYNFKRDI